MWIIFLYLRKSLESFRRVLSSCIVFWNSAISCMIFVSMAVCVVKSGSLLVKSVPGGWVIVCWLPRAANPLSRRKEKASRTENILLAGLVRLQPHPLHRATSQDLIYLIIKALRIPAMQQRIETEATLAPSRPQKRGFQATEAFCLGTF